MEAWRREAKYYLRVYLSRELRYGDIEEELLMVEEDIWFPSSAAGWSLTPKGPFRAQSRTESNALVRAKIREDLEARRDRLTALVIRVETALKQLDDSDREVIEATWLTIDHNLFPKNLTFLSEEELAEIAWRKRHALYRFYLRFMELDQQSSMAG